MATARRHVRGAFTLIELLVVIAIIALLFSILLPSLQKARAQSKCARCLSQMQEIARGCLQYSTEDPRQQIIPIHQMLVRPCVALGGSAEWCWRTAEAYSYGGRTGTKAFVNSTALMDETGVWATHTRPLNRQLYGRVDYTSVPAGLRRMELFQCPSDTGYPDSPWVHDAPANITGHDSVYALLGNSYRINPLGVSWISGAGQSAAFSSGAFGHSASSVEGPARVVLLSEPMFYNYSRQSDTWYPDETQLGWHGKPVADNVTYCDGSARTTRVGRVDKFDDQTLKDMDVKENAGFLRRGQTWQTDCYPSKGAAIVKYTWSGSPLMDIQGVLQSQKGWPFRVYEVNEPP
jgi:prepilin-type N-terminal cleavage/methylation domain-containing protein